MGIFRSLLIPVFLPETSGWMFGLLLVPTLTESGVRRVTIGAEVVEK